MRRCIPLGGLLLAAVTVAPASAQQDRALAILDAASAKYDAAHTVCADFVQHLSVPLLKEERTGKGRLCQAHPNRFAMRFTDPAGDAIVADGTSVWVYYPSLDAKQVMKFPMAEAPGGYDLNRAFLSDPGSKYTLTYEAKEPVAGRPCDRIRLVPKTDASFKSAEVWVDASDSVLRQVRVEDENGSVRTLTLQDVRMNAEVPAGWFTFTPPPGAQVITPPGGGGGAGR
jgi:chaperone LolA